jgi:hypothetical protein
MTPSSAFTAHRARHLLLGAAILSATVLACFPMAPDAHAATGSCTSEPVAILSNGYALDMDATIQDDASDVQNVNYTLKVPSGVSLVSWTDTAALGPKDSHSVSSSGSSGSYRVSVQAKTGAQVSVTASTVLVNAGGAHVSSNSASGHSSEQLSMSVSG